ncbi:MAG: response regulator transcription factor [Ilumatobacteraceae bacterium]
MARGDVLVVEDTPEYTQVVTAALSNVGFTVRTVGTVADALQALDVVAADLVVLDLGLPDGDGFDLCRVVRERTNAYILILTVRAEEVDLLLGFRLGADDYMTKPFSTRELVARVEAMMRRPRGDLTGAIVRRFGDVTIDLRSRECHVDGSPVELTRIEFDLLATLSDDPRAVFTRRQLLDRVWGDGWVGDDHVVDVHIANLRKKIDHSGDQSAIRTVRGVGYGFTLP